MGVNKFKQLSGTVVLGTCKQASMNHDEVRPTMPTGIERPTNSKTPREINHFARSTPKEQGIPSEDLMDVRLATKKTTVDEIVRYSLSTKEVGPTNRFYLERWAASCGALKLHLLTPATLRGYTDRGQSTGSQRRELGALIAAVNHWLRENDPMGAQQQLAMMRPKENPGRDRVLEAEEELAMEVGFTPELWAVARFCLRTGARPFEARALTGKDVSALNRTVKLRHRKGTSEWHVREVPVMDDAVMDDLMARVKRHGPGILFRCTSGLAWKANNLRAQWDKQKALCGLLDLQWTDLRHTFATRMGRAGVNATTIADLLGHTNLGLVQRYVQVSSLDREDAVRRGIA